ncbi:MAG TPA: branched-chain amino acid ABC transporter permease [Candidatus Sulfotelmatobacter sp.]|nr:branched-chain amino acid ABC transporter permease [Candidatus Sulfotelmatobacter sp.]
MKKWLLAAGVLAALACIPLFVNTYHQFMLNLILVNFLACLGMAILLGYCGQFAFASSAFLGVGAYSVGLSMVHFGLSYWIALPLAALVSLLFAGFIGFIGLRLTRYYLAISTIAFTLAMRFFYVNAGAVTFGPSGFNIPAPRLFGLDLNTDTRIYYLLFPVVLGAALVTARMLRSKVGRAFIAIRDKEEAASAAAIDTRRYKMLAFAMSGVLGGIAGGLYCVMVGRITPDEFGMGGILLHFLVVVLGGLGNLTGLVISSIFITLLPELVRAVREWQEIVYGAVILIVILFAPEGLYGLLQKYSPYRFREKLYAPVNDK